MCVCVSISVSVSLFDDCADSVSVFVPFALECHHIHEDSFCLKCLSCHLSGFLSQIGPDNTAVAV